MPALNAATLLAAWEEGLTQLPVERALTLLAAAWPERPVEAWADVSIGERDARLLTLREELFGATLDAVAECGQCGERLELTFRTQDVRVPVAALLPALREGEGWRLETGGCEVRFRAPTSADLRAIAKDPAAATGDGREILLLRCVRSARRGDAAVDPANLPAEVLAAVLAEMAKADPQADVQVALRCPACQHCWSLAFDVLSFLWNEIEDWARRLLRDVHVLATAYGWREQDILALSARRREFYLEMLT